MICSCVCTKSSSSPLENSKHQGNSKFCNSCGGRLLAGGREAQQGSMLSNGGLELSRVINPHLTWKTASNGRQRAVRRARTSFTGVNRKISNAESLKVNKDPIDKNSKSTEDMAVSESEKVSVSILGRRFSDNLGSVPIKKRKFSVVHSPSSLHHSSSYSDDLGLVLERQMSSYHDTVLNEIRNSLDSNSASRSEFGLARNLGIEGTDLQGVNEKICDAADFSGISILAAAACDSNIGCEFMDVEGSLSKAHAMEVQGAQEENYKLDLLNKKEEPLSQTSEALIGRTDLPYEESSLPPLLGKESNEVKSDGSISSFQSIRNKTEESSSHDIRFPWDLNTAIDAWEGHEEVLNSDREATNLSKGADRNEQLGNLGLHVNQVSCGQDKNVPIGLQVGDSRDHLGGDECEVSCAPEMKAKEKLGISGGNLAKDSEESKSVSSPCVDTCVEEKHLEDAKTDMSDSEETKTSMNKDKICIASGNFPSPFRGAMVSVAAGGDFLLSSDAVLEERKEETGKSSFLVSYENAAVDPPINDSGTHHGINNGPTEAGSLKTEKHQSLCVNFSVCPLAEKNSELLVEVNAHESMTGAGISGSNARMDVLNETDHNGVCEGKDARDCDAISVEMKMDMPKKHVLMEDSDSATNDFPANIGSDMCVFKSSDVAPSNTNAPAALNSHGDSTKVIDNSSRHPVQVSLENHLEYRNCPETSQNDADQAIGMEKVEILGDDDSQYEDGEFRESLVNCWLDDGAEDGETEHVDYESDRDTDFYEAASNLSSVNHVNNTGELDAEAAKDTQNASQSFPNYSSLLGVGAAKRNAGSTLGKGSPFLGNLKTATGEVASEGNVVNEADGDRKSSRSVGVRKISGWDRLPGNCRNSESRLVSSSQNHSDFSSDPSHECRSINRGIRSSSRRDLSSRMERVHSSVISRRNDRSYDRPSRSNGCNGFNPRVERHGPPAHLQGRGRGDNWVDSFSHHGNSRHDSSGYYGSRNAAAAVNASSQNTRQSPMGRGSPIERERILTMAPGHSREKSADRSAFSGPGISGRYGHGMDSLSHRERFRGPMPDDIINSPPLLHHTISRRDRSFSPARRRPLHLSHSRSRSPSRSRTRSPHRWSFSRARSQNVMNGSRGLRRRSRSPNFNFEARMDGPQAGFGEQIGGYASSSRNYASPPHPSRWIDGRNEMPDYFRDFDYKRGRSPPGRPRAGFEEHVGGYASLSRGYASPPHPSRWIDGRKEIPDYFRDFDYKRCPGRSPPGRVFSREQRPDLRDSERRPRQNEYCTPSNSGRFKEFTGFGRGSRNDGKGADRGEHDDRYETLNSVRQYVNGGNVKRYDVENGFGAQNVRSNPSKFQRRDSLRSLDRDAERHRGDSPRRSKDEKGHFINGNDGNLDVNFNSFGVRDGGATMAAQRELQ